MRIEEICRRARAEGLTYGQYVLKHKLELAGKRPTMRKRREGAHYCKWCSREFVPQNNRQLFCRTSCRVAWHREERRGDNTNDNKKA